MVGANASSGEQQMAAAADLGKMKLDDFSACLDQGFEAHTAHGRAISLKLAEVEAADQAAEIKAVWQAFLPASTQDRHIPMSGQHAEAAAKAKPEIRRGGAFTLRFEAVKGPPLRQGTYVLRHPKLGLFPLFLVPGKTQDGTASYYATFS
jgi:hypothetical protein